MTIRVEIALLFTPLHHLVGSGLDANFSKYLFNTTQRHHNVKLPFLHILIIN